jgi:hypothetical protein
MGRVSAILSSGSEPRAQEAQESGSRATAILPQCTAWLRISSGGADAIVDEVRSAGTPAVALSQFEKAGFCAGFVHPAGETSRPHCATGWTISLGVITLADPAHSAAPYRWSGGAAAWQRPDSPSEMSSCDSNVPLTSCAQHNNGARLGGHLKAGGGESYALPYGQSHTATRLQ